MILTFTCPECSSEAILDLPDTEVERIKQIILTEGRSPTLIARCATNHSLLVTLYFRNDSLAVRDIRVPLNPPSDDEESDEMDWVTGVFGGKRK
ncbi:MAG: hypothetical protein BAJATHORv1_10646 [Candidatus Thorarchaeota archaeon]|nr:MAG: hypothetical protein BAJATHORv1_10646 [Candidatus Thorarchaeota archaeon]